MSDTLTAGVLATTPIERNAVADELIKKELTNRNNTDYIKGTLRSGRGDHRIILKQISQGGLGERTSIRNMEKNFNLDVILLVGQAAGMNESKLGDIIIARSIRESDSGITGNEDGLERLDTKKPESEIKESIKPVGDSIVLNWHQDCKCNCGGEVRAGRVLSCNKVMKRDDVNLRDFDDYAAVSMSGQGVYEDHEMLDTPGLVILVVSDIINKINRHSMRQSSESEDLQRLIADHSSMFISCYLDYYDALLSTSIGVKKEHTEVYSDEEKKPDNSKQRQNQKSGGEDNLCGCDPKHRQVVSPQSSAGLNVSGFGVQFGTGNIRIVCKKCGEVIEVNNPNESLLNWIW